MLKSPDEANTIPWMSEQSKEKEVIKSGDGQVKKMS